MPIAFDATTHAVVGASPRTLSHTCSAGDNRLLFVCTFQPQAADDVSGVTYGGVAMTKINTVAPDAGINYFRLSLWYLIAPATGANNVVATASSGTVGIRAISYTGAKQSGVPDASTTVGPDQASPITGTLTTVASNAWMAMFVSDGGANPAASTGSTLRGAANMAAAFDSNAGLTPGLNSMEVTWGGGSTGNALVVSFAPVPDSINIGNRVSSNRLELGVGFTI